MNASPAARPTEWTTAFAGIVTAVIMFSTDHNIAALVSAIGGFLPALLTAAVAFLRSRKHA